MIYLLSQILDSASNRFPNHQAFRCEGKAITYAELLRRANGLAHWLVENGVRRGDRVGIYLSKSLESAVSIYGIWKAGAAYVPLDPAAPIARTAYVVNHCGIRHLITQPSKRRKLPQLLAASPELRWIVGLPDSFDLSADLNVRSEQTIIRCEWAGLPSEETAPDVRLVAKDLAYIMYTSGSTGKPKGIMHSHYSGLSYARLAASTYGLNERDRLGNHSPLHFDISTLGFFSGPLVGATTVIIPEAYTKLPASLSQLIQDEALTVWYSVPFALSQLCLRGVLSERKLDALRWVLFAGEPFPTKYLYALMAQIPQARFSNIYGPAEVNQCTYYHVPPLLAGRPVSTEALPIGRVWNNSEAIVVDEQDQPVSQGQLGELLIRTATMMSGYWRRPDLNDKAFYHTQVAGQPAVFYRTGDLVQQQSDGEYRFIGRKDRQVKIRGYRVELDEVEATLVGHSQVEEAATYPVSFEPGRYEIEAAIILRADACLEEAEIKRYVAERLPAYAVPQRVVIASEFPRTGTGKIDRKALQELATNSS